MAPPVGAITNVTALIGRDLEPERCHIYIRDGVIAGISPVSDDATPLVTAPPPNSELLEGTEPITIDGEDLIAIPGMVDVHDHFRVLAPGLPVAEGLPLDEFLRVQWATQAHMSTDEYEAAAVLGCVQRLKCGITAVVDHAYTFHEPGLDEACISAYEACGIRWAYARGIMTRPYEPVCESFEQAADNIRALLEGTALTPERLFVAPVSIRQATVEEFARSAALAAELGAGTYTHASETEAERAVWKREAKASPIVALDRAGFLTERTVLAHCVILDDAEIDLLAERGSHVAHCPSNNMRLAKGVTRVPDLLAAGVNVCLGVDMMNDMHSEMRAELQMQSLHSGDPAVLSARDVLQMATWRGAAAAFPAASVPADTFERAADAALSAVGRAVGGLRGRHRPHSGPLAAAGPAARPVACCGPSGSGAVGAPCAGGGPHGGGRRLFHFGGRGRSDSGRREGLQPLARRARPARRARRSVVPAPCGAPFAGGLVRRCDRPARHVSTGDFVSRGGWLLCPVLASTMPRRVRRRGAAFVASRRRCEPLAEAGM